MNVIRMILCIPGLIYFSIDCKFMYYEPMLRIQRTVIWQDVRPDTVSCFGVYKFDKTLLCCTNSTHLLTACSASILFYNLIKHPNKG